MTVGRAVFEAVANFQPLIRESKEASRALRDVDTAAGDIGKNVDAGSQQAQRGIAGIGARAGEMGRKMEESGRRATVGMTLPLAAIGVVAVKTFADFESSITQAGLKADATTSQMAAMKDMALELGSTTKFNAREAAAGMDELAAAGFNAEQVMQAMPGVIQAAQASNSDLAQTAQITAQAMNAFNLEAKDAGHVADVFASAANTTALDMTGLGQALAHAGQLGASANQDLEDVVATFGRMVDMGVPAASAGAAVRQAMQSLQAPTKKAAGYLDALGIETRDAKGEMLPLPRLLKNLEDGLSASNPEFVKMGKETGKSGQELRDFALDAMFGVEGMKAISLSISDGKPLILDLQKDTDKMARLQRGLNEALGKEGADAFLKAHTAGGKFTATGADAVQAIAAMSRESDGLSAKFAKVFGETTGAKLDNLVGSVETLGIVLIDTVAPGLDRIIGGLTEFIELLGKVAKVPFVGPVVIGLAVLLAALGPILIVVGKIGQGLETIGKFRGPKNVSSGKGKGKGAGAASGGGSTTLSGRVQVWWATAMPVYVANAPAARPGAPGAPGAPAGSAPADEERRRRRGPSGRQVAGGVGIGALLGGGMTAADGGGTAEIAKSAAMFAGVTLAVNLLIAALPLLGAAFVAVGSAIVAAFVAVGLIPVLIVAALIAIGVAIWKWRDEIWAAIKSAWDWVKNATVVAWEAIKGALSAAWAWVSSTAAAVWRAIAGFFVGLWNGIRGAAVAAWNGIGAFLSAVWNGIKGAAIAVWNALKAAVEGIVRGLGAALSAIWGGIKAAAGAVWGAITAVVTGAARGLADGLSAIWGGIKTAFSAAWGALTGIVSGVFEGIKGIVGRAVSWVTDKVAAIGGAIGGTLKGAVSWIPGMSKGGLVGGSGTGDTQLRMLDPREFVLTADAVQRIGIPALRALNAGQTIGGDGAEAPSLSSLLSASEAGRVSSTRSLTGVAAGTGRGGTAAVNGGETNVTSVSLTVHNPKPERASTSLHREAQKLSTHGVIRLAEITDRSV